MARFRTRARAVDLLGKQQIRDEVTAISELLRNSYDADAGEGLVNVNTKLDRIILWDDGHGMNAQDIENHWLTLGTHSKNTKKIKRTKKNRIKIGEKGIGRLAISILGNQLLLVSKKENEDQWAVLYLHWDLFRNENIYLEDINVPIYSFNTCNEIIHFLQNKFSILQTELLSNFADRSLWDIEQIHRITNEINNFNINNEIINQIKKINSKQQGTLFYITQIDDTWDWNFCNSNNSDAVSTRKRQRLEDQLYSFQNLIELYQEEVNSSIKDINSFTPNIIVNQENFSSKEWFNEEDINLYDYALKGTINNGKFDGELLVRNSKDNIQSFYRKDVDLTTGVYNSTISSCGPIKVNFFFIEGKLLNSSLTKDEHRRMEDKLEHIGGIYVFRDGLRILPYGEPGNDFLEIEKRRTLRAGTYLFSYRRMFGYVEISKLDNPHLVDKSSREGFIENQYYYYFREVLINLLKWWAKDFLESENKKNGKRSSRLQQLAEEQLRRDQQKMEEIQEKKYLRKLEKQMDLLEDNLNIKKEEINKELESILVKLQYESDTEDLNFGKLTSRINSAKLNSFDLIKSLDELFIIKNSRYFLDIETGTLINELNEKISIEKEKLSKNFLDSLSSIEKIKRNKIETTLNAINANPNTDQIQEITKHINFILKEYNQIPNRINENKQLLTDKISNKASCLIKNITIDYNRIIESEYSEFILNYNDSKQGFDELIHIQEKLESTEAYFYTEELFAKATESLTTFEQKLNVLHNQLMNINQNIEHSAELTWIENYLSLIEQEYNKRTDLYADDKLIGLLKKEITMYRDISAIGLAAELTSHEFNALYYGIKQDLSLLNKALKNTRALPLVLKIQKAFTSLEKMHNRMSPLYRQSRMLRKEINLKSFIESIIEYFNSDLKRYNINTFIEVPDNLVIKEAEPILFTPLVNLISNAIYWLINQETKEIHFYVNQKEHSILIHDSGPGINKNDSPFIFEPYYSKKASGRGLGLFLSRDLLESKGHELYLLTNENSVKNLPGACFCIKLKKDSFIYKGEI
ncbi:ATP-binding protein [Bacillus sp. SBS7]|uniref:ATP-binding protein n=1 Tax=Bacillus sp. SBS7 TaxID=3401756 RepID=UPI003AA9630D